GGLTGDSTADTVAGAQAGKNAVENNSLHDIIDNKVSGVTQEQKYQNAQKELVAAVEEFKAQNCAGISADACSAKIQANSDELLKGFTGFGIDFVPVIGDIKSVAEAQSALDYLIATIGFIPGIGDAAGKLIKAAETALKKGDVAEASSLINKASGEISAHSATNGLNLNKSLANEAQLADLIKNGGTSVAGKGAKDPLRDAPRLAAEYGGKAEDWSKVSSSSYKAADGTIFEIHAYRNGLTGKVVEPKSIPIQKTK
uniref:VENN motif pre-toxin domain-containing protein n=1 Tax=Yersinia thracica TaxID=2890319 RepID=UPI001F345321